MVLQTGELSAATRKVLETEFAKHDSPESLKGCLRTQRAFGLSAFRDSTPWSEHWLTRGFSNREQSYYLDFLRKEIDAADQPHWKYSLPRPTKTHVLVNLIMPIIQVTRQAEARVRAELRCLRVLNALQALPVEQQTLLPKLSTLNLPADATIDPFSGKELRVKKLSAGWLVYSVGANGKDDGGNLKDSADVGLGPPPARKESKP